jgi:phage repressor protein C with HTH and peptisase S24 domain
MKLLKSFGKLRKPNILLLRQVRGESMSPTIRHGQLVLATGFLVAAAENDVVIIRRYGREMIKRISLTDPLKGVYVVGDNAQASTDSRSFGWLQPEEVIAKVIWPRT